MAGLQVSALEDVKAEGNWMWASKLPGEGALMYDTALALREVMHELGVGIDGGKDSLSMSARSDDGELCKCPGELTISLYCGYHPAPLAHKKQRPTRTLQ